MGQPRGTNEPCPGRGPISASPKHLLDIFAKMQNLHINTLDARLPRCSQKPQDQTSFFVLYLSTFQTNFTSEAF